MPSCSIIIPIYRGLTTGECDLVRHNLAMLQGFPAILIGGHGQSDLLSDTRKALQTEDSADISVQTFDDRYFQDIVGYNELLVSREFYERFSENEYILICQHDAIILKPCLADWLGREYAFVGSPMFEGYHDPVQPRRFLPSLNGGLSLRRVSSALTVLENALFLHRTRAVRAARRVGLIAATNALLSLFGPKRLVVKREGLNEDVLWSRDIAAAFPAFKVPQPEEASRFAFEVCPAELFELTGGTLPFGCHAFERYDPEFWLAHAPPEAAAIIRAMLPCDGPANEVVDPRH